MLYANGYPVGGGGSGSTEIIADDFDATSTYAVGDYVVYDGKLYKCTTAVSTAGQWDANDWTETIVMDEVGQGGGGTGGHTIIDENGDSMTARAGLQFVGGANVSDDATNNKTIVDLASAGGIDGVFINVLNKIDTINFSNGSFSYTATQDCFVKVPYTSQGNTIFKLDNINYKAEYDSGIYKIDTFLLKKGQELKLSNAKAESRIADVYGIQTGTTHSKFQPVIYSTEEREIGVWTDGKPLYEKTIDCGALPNNTTKTVSHGISNFEHMVGYSGVAFMPNVNDIPIPFVHNSSIGDNICFFIDSSEITLRTSSNKSGYTASYITLRYTKTTDVAGSGSWTPQGVPTHHYSTDEKVIGTWIDGSTIYEKTFEINIQNAETGSWKATSIQINNINKIIAHSFTNSSGNDLSGINVANLNSYINIMNLRNASQNYVGYLTLQYTKST